MTDVCLSSWWQRLLRNWFRDKIRLTAYINIIVYSLSKKKIRQMRSTVLLILTIHRKIFVLRVTKDTCTYTACPTTTKGSIEQVQVFEIWLRQILICFRVGAWLELKFWHVNQIYNTNSSVPDLFFSFLTKWHMCLWCAIKTKTEWYLKNDFFSQNVLLSAKRHPPLLLEWQMFVYHLGGNGC